MFQRGRIAVIIEGNERDFAGLGPVILFFGGSAWIFFVFCGLSGLGGSCRAIGFKQFEKCHRADIFAVNQLQPVNNLIIRNHFILTC